MLFELLLAAAGVATDPPSAPVMEQADSQCSKPTLLNNPAISTAQLNDLIQRAQDYIDCRSKEIDAQRKVADDTLAVARSAAEKSNAMAADLNTFVTDVKAYIDEHNNG